MAQLAPEDESKLQERVTKVLNSGKDSLNIITIGMKGVGKSSLINSLVGCEVAIEREIPLKTPPKAIDDPRDDLTYESYKTKKTLEGTGKFIDITMWDTSYPDNHDPAPIFEMCKGADVILHCMRMDYRLAPEVRSRICTGSEMLKNTVFALTFGNTLRPRRSNPVEDPCTYFLKQLESWQRAIRDFLKEQGVPEDLVSTVPIIPAGYGADNPPDRTNWVDSFWKVLFIQKFLPKVDAKRALIGIIHRIQPIGPQLEGISEELCKKPKMYHLTTQVVPTVKAKWEELAYSLHFEYHTVQAINWQDVTTACRHVLGRWLDGEGEREPRTWATLLVALREIGNSELAEQIQHTLLTK